MGTRIPPHSLYKVSVSLYVCVCADTSLYIQWDAYFKKVSHKFVFIKKISYLYSILIRHSDLRINTKSIRNSYILFTYVYPSYVCVRM